jgi:hypothetical protein
LVGVEQWAELRREHFVRGVSIKALARRTGLSRNTVRAALRSPEPPGYQRAPAGSKLDPFKAEIHQLLKKEPDMPGQRVRELIEPLGFDGGKTIVDDYLRDVRALFAPPRIYQRAVYRPGEICQFDLWLVCRARGVASACGARGRQPRDARPQSRHSGPAVRRGRHSARGGGEIGPRRARWVMWSARRGF